MNKVSTALCEQCPLYGGTLVPGRGELTENGTARCVIVGEGPGKQEVVHGTVFVGPSGQLLSRLMERFVTGSYWITNAGLCGVGEGSAKEAAARCCANRLREEIASKHPVLIISLGNIPTDILTQVSGKITQRRGIVTEASILGHNYPILPTFHPAAVLRNSAYLSDVIADFKLAQQLLQAPTISCGVVNPPCNYEVAEDYQDVLRKAQESTFAVLDLETSGLRLEDSRILCAVIATDSGIYILPQHVVYSEGFKAALSTAQVKWSGHNAKFDRGMLMAEIGVPLHFAFDTMLAHYLIDPRQGAQEESRGAHGLKDIAQRIYSAPDWEVPIHAVLAEVKSKSYADVPLSMLYKYAAYDGYYQRLLTYDLAKQIAADPQKLKVFKTLLMPGMHALSNAEVRGVAIDRAGLEALKPKYRARAQMAEHKMAQVIGHDINPRSPKQVAVAMFDELRLRQLEGRSTSAKTVLKMYTNPHPFVSALLDYREAYTIVSRYLNLDEYLSHTGRVHTTFNLHRTATGRLCVSHDTPIEMPRDMVKYPQGVPISELKEGDWVYSFDWTKRLCLKRVKWIGCTGYKQTIKITARDECTGELVSVRLTPEHLVRLWAGDWRPAGKLKVGNRLLCMVRRGTKEEGYFYFFPSSKNRSRKNNKSETSGRILEHRFVYAQTQGLDRLPPQWDAHHIDENKQNNAPDNLEFIYHLAHLAMHRHKTSKEDVEAMLNGEKELTINKKTLRRLAREYGLLGTNHTIVAIEEGTVEEVWDLEIEDTHTFIGGGVALHNSSTAPNLQNQPSRILEAKKDIKDLYTADAGMLWSEADMSQLEYRVIAYLSKDPYLIQCYQEGRDLHGETAAIGWGPSYTAAQRAQAKTANFSLLYGASEAGFLSNGLIDIPVPIKRKIVAGFFSKMPKVVEYNEWLRQEVRRTGIVTTPSGRVRKFPEVLIASSPSDWNMIYREAVNTPPQGGASDATLLALINLDRMGFDIRLTVHDSVAVQGPAQDIRDIAATQIRVMSESAAELYGDLIPFPTEVQIGPRWGSLQEVATWA